jgi:hypothetical protein
MPLVRISKNNPGRLENAGGQLQITVAVVEPFTSEARVYTLPALEEIEVSDTVYSALLGANVDLEKAA